MTDGCASIAENRALHARGELAVRHIRAPTKTARRCSIRRLECVSTLLEANAACRGRCEYDFGGHRFGALSAAAPTGPAGRSPPLYGFVSQCRAGGFGDASVPGRAPAATVSSRRVVQELRPGEIGPNLRRRGRESDRRQRHDQGGFDPRARRVARRAGRTERNVRRVWPHDSLRGTGDSRPRAVRQLRPTHVGGAARRWCQNP